MENKKETNFERITKDEKSLMRFVQSEVLDIAGPHMNHSIEKFVQSRKFMDWLKEESSK